jgi:hypothetical protein
MKKSLIALAALAAFGTASAQSTVTLSGSYGFGAEKSSATAQGINQTNGAIAINAVEDLGGGLKLAASVAFDIDRERGDAPTGADRSITLTTGFGAISLGNTRTATLLAGVVGGSTVADIYTRVATAQAEGDAVGFTTKLGDVTVGLNHFGYEAATTARNTSTLEANEARISYAVGPFALTGSILKHSGTSTASRNELVGSYNAGVATVSLGFSDTSTDTDSMTAIGVSVPVSAFKLNLGMAKKGTDKFTTYGADYSFSKTATLRAHFSVDDNNGTKVNGYRVQLVKAF